MSSSKTDESAPAGRLSLIGAAVTLLEVAHMCGLFILLPLLSFQRLFCSGQLQDQQHQCSSLETDPLQTLCDSSSSILGPLLQSAWMLWWIIGEAIFYAAMKIKLIYLQSIDPQESYFKATNVMTPGERQVLWDRVMKADSHDMIGYFESWFFDTPLDEITMEEFKDFITWGYFDNRNQEHLNEEETQQLNCFVKDTMERMSIQKRGVGMEEEANKTPTKPNNNTAAEDHHNNLLRRGTTFATEESTSSTDDDDISVASWTPCQECDPRNANVIAQRLELHQTLLHNALAQSRNIPQAEVAQIMRRITKLHKESQKAKLTSLEAVSHRNRRRSTPDYRFGRPTADPLLGVRIFPLILHLLVFLTCEMAGQVLLWLLGFRRGKIGSIAYHYRPGRRKQRQGDNNNNNIPLVFIHGIGVGPIVYLPLIIQMIITTKSCRPIFIPEVQSVSAFRPWIMPSDALTPDKVVTSLSLMLASRGYCKATFAAHSFGTFWMSYMIKYAPNLVAAAIFLDPVNFCLKNSLLTRRVVYNQPDPGDVGYLIKTDMMVNWSVQRNFSWVRGNLFVEDLSAGDSDNNTGTPCAVFLSGKDRVAPASLQQAYLENHDSTSFRTKQANDVTPQDFQVGNTVVVFPECDHGLWMLNPLENLPKVVTAMEVLTKRIEKQ